MKKKKKKSAFLYLSLHPYLLDLVLSGFFYYQLYPQGTHSHMWVLATGCQTKDPPPHNVLFSTNTPECLWKFCLYKLLWALWVACTTQPVVHGQGHSTEREAEKEGRILAAVGSTSIRIIICKEAPLGDLNSFLRQLHGAADIRGSLLCVPLLSLVFSLQCLGKKGTA